jgi:2'-5' RNA ligase
MPHITLLYPFRPRHEFTALSQRFAQDCADVPPFEVELSVLRWFRHRSSYTVWLAPEPREALVNLQTTLWRCLSDCDEVRQHMGGFTPHLSVGQVHGRGPLTELLTELEHGWTPLRFWASGVTLIWRNDPPDDAFRVGEFVKLGGTSQ